MKVQKAKMALSGAWLAIGVALGAAIIGVGLALGLALNSNPKQKS